MIIDGVYYPVAEVTARDGYMGVIVGLAAVAALAFVAWAVRKAMR